MQYKYWLIILFGVIIYFVKRYYKDERYGTPSEDYKHSVEQLFWNKIEKARNLASDNYEIQCQKLITLLEAESPEFIIQFDKTFKAKMEKAYTWKLWAAIYIINGGCSDDCFCDFRSWLIGQGETVFESVVKNPDSLNNLNIGTDDWEGLLYSANQAYRELTEQDLPPYNILRNGEPAGDKWDEENTEQLKAMLPQLYLKYNGESKF